MTGDPIEPVITTQAYTTGVGTSILQDGEVVLNIDGQDGFDPALIALQAV